MAYNAKKTSHIDKFNGTDFTFWKKQVLIVLKVHKLDKVADGTFLCPVQEIDADGNPLLNEAGVATQQETIQEWNDKDLQAQDLLFSTTDPGTISTRFHFSQSHRDSYSTISTRFYLTQSHRDSHCTISTRSHCSQSLRDSYCKISRRFYFSQSHRDSHLYNLNEI